LEFLQNMPQLRDDNPQPTLATDVYNRATTGTKGIPALAAASILGYTCAVGVGYGVAAAVGSSGLSGGGTIISQVGATSGAGGILVNQSWGNRWRDVIADGYRNLLGSGYDVQTEQFFSTPFGKRFLDVVIRDPTGRIIGAIEAKTGAARYNILQQLKDNWLMQQFNGPIFEYRYPFSSRPWFGQ
jgi:hypothetical protein